MVTINNINIDVDDSTGDVYIENRAAILAFVFSPNCESCKQMTPDIIKFANDHENINFAAININANPKFPTESIPVIGAFKFGKLLGIMKSKDISEESLVDFHDKLQEYNIVDEKPNTLLISNTDDNDNDYKVITTY